MGFEIQENEVTAKFHEKTYSATHGRQRTTLRAFMDRRHLRISLVAATDLDGDPLAGREELRELIELADDIARGEV